MWQWWGAGRARSSPREDTEGARCSRSGSRCTQTRLLNNVARDAPTLSSPVVLLTLWCVAGRERDRPLEERSHLPAGQSRVGPSGCSLPSDKLGPMSREPPSP